SNGKIRTYLYVSFSSEIHDVCPRYPSISGKITTGKSQSNDYSKQSGLCRRTTPTRIDYLWRKRCGFQQLGSVFTDDEISGRNDRRTNLGYVFGTPDGLVSVAQKRTKSGGYQRYDYSELLQTK